MSKFRLGLALSTVGIIGTGLAAGGIASADSQDAPSTPAAAPSTTSTPAAASAKLLPSSGAYFGMYYGDKSPQQTAQDLGSTPKLHLTYVPWAEEWGKADFIKSDLNQGQIPVVNWEPYGGADGDSPIDFNEIVSGKYDAMIKQRATEAKAINKEFFLDFAAEMNSDQGFGDHNPELYKAAYRHVHDIFTQQGATNVVWVWAPNNRDYKNGTEGVEYYPGAEYVDWTAIDGYNWGDGGAEDTSWESMSEVFGPMYKDLHKLGKPILIAEMASAENGGSKASWVNDIIPTLKSEFPDIRGLIWFDVNKERDWRIASSPDSASAIKKMVNDPYFNANKPASNR